MFNEKTRSTMRCDRGSKLRQAVSAQPGGPAGSPAQASDPVALRPYETAAKIGVTPETLANWQWLGRGPDNLKLGATGGAGAYVTTARR